MIARIFLLLIIIILLPAYYVDRHFLRKKHQTSLGKRILWYAPFVLMTIFTIVLALQKDFIPDDITWIDVYLLLIGIVFAPIAVFALCSIVGYFIKKRLRSPNNWGNILGLLLGFIAACCYLYGAFVQVNQLKEKTIDISFADLPAAFDGYNILLFSDAHLGSFQGWRKSGDIDRVIEKINAQHADAVCFLGDIQNTKPTEIYPFLERLRTIHAKDGVFSVLGNHDYSEYCKGSDAIRVANEKETVQREREMGWTVLQNEHKAIQRGNDSIVFAGAGNLKKPDKADFQQIFSQIKQGAFTIVLEHNPEAWRNEILPNTTAQLTFSGHTHGGQIAICGLSFAHLFGREIRGLYRDGDRAIIVTSGIGALVPFRFGVKPEIIRITLHKSNA